MSVMGCGLLVIPAHSANPQFLIETIAGGMLPPQGVPGTSAALPQLSYGIAVDSSGNVYFSSASQNVVFRLSAAGSLSVVAGIGGPGQAGGYRGDGGSAFNASLNGPRGLVLDAQGNLYIADYFNNRVRKVDTNGIITTVAGSGFCCSPDNGPAINANIKPTSLALDASGNLYIGEAGFYRVRKVDTSGMMTTVAGTGVSGYSGDGGAATSAQITGVFGLAVDAAGNLYLNDRGNYRIRKVSGGIISTIAGTGVNGYSGDNGPASSAQIGNVNGLAMDDSGNLYLADTGNYRIRMISGGTITTVAGTGVAGTSGDGGAATSAMFYSPYAIAVRGSTLYVSEWYTNRIRKITSGTVTTIAGGVTGDTGPAVFAGIGSPGTIAKDGLGNLYFADSLHHTIRKISGGIITTVAGTGISGYSGDGGPAVNAKLNFPAAVVVDSSGNLYISDTQNQRIRKVGLDGNISTIAGTGSSGYGGDNGPAIAAQFANPSVMVLDGQGNLYIADTNNYRIRMIAAATGTITTVVGSGVAGPVGDNGPATSAQLTTIYALAFDASGSLILADSYRIRKVSSGIITTIAGTQTAGYQGDGGPATNARIQLVWGLAGDAFGNVYLADSANQRIRMISNGIITTVAGNGSYGFDGDGGLSTDALLANPQALLADPSGSIYVADADNGAIRLLVPLNTQPVLVFGDGTPGGNWTAGSTDASLSLTVGDAAGAGNLNGTVTFTWNPGPGITVTSQSGTGWSCSGLACTRSDALAAGTMYPPINSLFSISANAPRRITLAGMASGGGAMGIAGSGVITLAPQPSALSISKTHAGNFSQGQTGAAYTLTVSNGASAGPTSGTVTVTEFVPSGMTLVSMAGTGWTCPNGGNTCTRSDVLAAGSSYPIITVTVNVASNAAASVLNQVSVTGGGSASANNTASDPTNITPVSSHPAFFSGEAALSNGVYFLQFANSNLFGYYSYLPNGWIYHIDMGYEFVMAAGTGVYMWDFASGHWLFTTASNFPYLYDFNLNTWIFYFTATGSPGHYTANPRWFANLTTSGLFTM